jgi:hypothetical protein
MWVYRTVPFSLVTFSSGKQEKVTRRLNAEPVLKRILKLELWKM